MFPCRQAQIARKAIVESLDRLLLPGNLACNGERHSLPDAGARLCVAGMRWSRRPIGGLGLKLTRPPNPLREAPGPDAHLPWRRGSFLPM
jgi:hypothetical protein